MAKVGVWAFIVGLVVAILAGFVNAWWITPVLVVVGLLVGLLNISDKETNAFLMASVSVMIAVYTAGGQLATLTTLGAIGTYLKSLLMSINVLVFPATIVVAIKSIYNIAKD